MLSQQKKEWIALLASILVLICFLDTAYASGDYSYEYKIVYSKWSDEKSTGWEIAGGQDENGTRFTTGEGSFFWVNSGGPISKVAFSANASLGYGACVVGVSMGVLDGKSAQTGEEIAVPGKKSYVKKHRYKLKVRKYVKVRSATLKKRLKNSSNSWTYVSTSYQKKVTAHDLGVKEVE